MSEAGSAPEAGTKDDDLGAAYQEAARLVDTAIAAIKPGWNLRELFMDFHRLNLATDSDDADNNLRILRIVGLQTALADAWAGPVVSGLQNLLRDAKRFQHTNKRRFRPQLVLIDQAVNAAAPQAVREVALVVAEEVFADRLPDQRAGSAERAAVRSFYEEQFARFVELGFACDEKEAAASVWPLVHVSDRQLAAELKSIKTELAAAGREGELSRIAVELVSSPRSHEGQGAQMTVDVFISHIEEDKAFAQGLVDLLLESRVTSARSIRCTTLEGFGFDVGEDWERALRREVTSARVVIGLISLTSPHSQWVLFELGARWGAATDREQDLPLLPVLVGGAALQDLPGALPARQACEGWHAGQVEDLVYTVSDLLGAPVEQDRATRARLRSAAVRFAELSPQP